MNLIDDTIDSYLNTRKEYKKKRKKRTEKLVKKTCSYCKQEFIGHRNKQFCRVKCYHNYIKERYHQNKQISPTVEKTCAHCGNKFQTFRAMQVYCTAKCRQEMWNKIYRERYQIAFGVKHNV